MSTTKAVKPTESPGDSDPFSRLVEALVREGFKTTNEESEWKERGEKIYRRDERVLFARGETVFVFIAYPEFSERILKQAVQGITHLHTAKGTVEKAMTVFQTTTVYVCIVAQEETPHNESLGRYISKIGGAIVIPVILIPEINQIVYPASEEKLGIVRPRIEYLQYLIGERREAPSMHRQTLQTFWASAGIVALIALALVFSMFT